MSRALLALGAALVATCGVASAADASPHVANEVVVTYRAGGTEAARAALQRAVGVGSARVIAARTELLRILDGESVDATVSELRLRPEVAAAAPNPVAHAGGWIPRDPGPSGTPGGWQAAQWNFAGPYGVNAPDAWANLIAVGRPGADGTTVAVLDTGVAYRSHGAHRRSPDFKPGDFTAGYDFVDRDRFPDDENGHGTHVAGTIGEGTDDGVGVTGLAFGAKLMPVRVLDSSGAGDSVTIAAGIRYAVRRGADVINLSFVFGSGTTARDLPDLLAALRRAHRRGVLVVAASGNESAPVPSYPALAPHVVAVGATTEHGCVASYSNTGDALDVMAPGGGADAPGSGDQRCLPEQPGADILQVTFDGSASAFGLPGDYAGTSMAAPHVSATAALIVASGVLGPDPSPGAIQKQLKATARPLGPTLSYGAGLVDAAAATRSSAASSTIVSPTASRLRRESRSSRSASEWPG
jgi:serine protease